MLITLRLSEDAPDEMCDLTTLKQWVRSGKVQVSHRICVSGSWMNAGDYEDLKTVFATAAWDLSEDVLWTPIPKDVVGKTVDVNSVVKQDTSKLRPKLPSSAIQPLDDRDAEQASGTSISAVPKPIQYEPVTNVPEKKHEDEQIFSGTAQPQGTNRNTAQSSNGVGTSEDFVQSMRDDYLRSKPSTSLQSNVSISTDENTLLGSRKQQEFVEISSKSSPQTPEYQRPLETKQAQWNPNIDIRDQIGLWGEQPTRSNFSWFRIGMMIVPGVFVLLGVRSFIIAEAQTEFPVDTEPVEQINSKKSGVDPLLSLELELKSKLMPNAQTVSPANSLSDALRVDLEYVGLDIIRIDAEVLKWTGRNLDLPKVATIVISIESRGELEHEFILASLVVAKYSVRYYLDMPTFEIKIRDNDGVFAKSIQTEKAQFLYLQPGSLSTFIKSMSEPE